MKNLKEIIKEAEQKGVAIGHFNISECAALKGIFAAAKELNLPVIIGVSEGEREFIGVKRAALFVKRLKEEFNFPIFINADHTKSLGKIKEAVEAGFDAVMFDASDLPLEENIKKTKEVVDYVKSVSASRRPPVGGEILVEAELGYLQGSSIILSTSDVNKIKKGDLTKPEEAAAFVKETGVDLLAPSVGNLHGMFKNSPNPNLDIERVKEIKKALQQSSGQAVPLVLHGGSGIRDEEFLKAIDAGISIIHINTELRLAWRRGLEKAFKEKPDEIVPYKLLPSVVEEIKKITYNRLKLFNKL
ncbi:MAG: class II fructose-bisphosphate aldolase, partial [Patescibacteria group bacterium]